MLKVSLYSHPSLISGILLLALSSGLLLGLLFRKPYRTIGFSNFARVLVLFVSDSVNLAHITALIQ